MLSYLRHIRAYLYTGTWPASYTLGLMEAMLSGVPVVAPPWSTGNPVLDGLYEAPEIVAADVTPRIDETYRLTTFLNDRETAGLVGAGQRQRAIDLFDVATVGPQWKAFLG